MSHELSINPGEGKSVEHHALPPRVDFQQIAQNALNGGLFVTDMYAIERNKEISREYGKYPTEMLDVPYIHGPWAIQRVEEDVKEEAVFAVRKNFIAANNLLLPPEQVLRYFHQRFYDSDVFSSDALERVVDDYSPHSLDTRFREESSLSFQTQGVDRKVHDRILFTEEEKVAGLELTKDHPEVVLTILTYESVLQDYFQELRGALVATAQRSMSEVTEKNLEGYDTYAKQWATDNFTHELLPALALFYRQKKEKNPTMSEDEIISQDVFQDAVNFIIANGAFRNWVEVPAHVALDGKERTNHFLCPAVGTIRDQLLDGALLGKINKIINEKVLEGDMQVVDYADTIRAKTVEMIAEQYPEPVDMVEEIARMYEERSKVTINYDDNEYMVNIDDHFSAFMSGEHKAGDIVIEPRIGSLFYDIMREAANTAIEQNVSVFFDFNDQKYRLTPEKVKEALQTMGIVKDSEDH